jgi:hypothetical protein
MHKTLTSIVALAGLAAAAGVAQAEPLTLIEEQADAVVGGDSKPMELSSSDMDGITAGGVAQAAVVAQSINPVCVGCANAAGVAQIGVAAAVAVSVFGNAVAAAD